MAKKSTKPKGTRRTAKRKAAKPRTTKPKAKQTVEVESAPEPSARGGKRFSDEQVADALRQTGGVFSDAARWLQGVYKRKCSRSAVCRYVGGSPYLQHVLQQVDEAKHDYAERRLWAHIEAGSERSLHFFMATKMKDRGYTKRTELSGPNGGALPVQNVPTFDLSGLDDDELRQFEELLARAGAAGSTSAVPSTG